MAGTALVLSVLALSVAVHNATPPARMPTSAPTLVSAPGPGEPLPTSAVSTVPATRQTIAPSTTFSTGSNPDPLRAWARQRATTYDIPERAFYAYGRATAELRAARPDCHLGWTTLAAIAGIESNHARYGGATIGADGSVSPPIRGVPLDGTHGNAKITTGSTYVRAEGPFQFLPDTWKRWGLATSVPARQLSAALGTGSQTSGAANGNPDNIDDAALTAARYLCADNHDLATATGWTAAIWAYNHSGTYLDQIHSAAIRYSARDTS